MEEITQILFLIGMGIPVLTTIGLFMIKQLMDLNKRVSRLEGRHQELDKKE